jgi:hypothetical protein
LTSISSTSWLGERVRLTLGANVINALNGRRHPTLGLFTGQGRGDEAEFYATGVDTQALIAQQGLVRDARFLMDSGYQAPRSIRLGVKLGF